MQFKNLKLKLYYVIIINKEICQCVTDSVFPPLNVMLNVKPCEKRNRQTDI